MTDIDYEKTFGFNPTSIGNRYRHHHLIDKPDYEDEQAGAKEGYLCVRARDGASNPIDPDACKHPNFVGTGEDDFDRTYRYYYYRPLTDADRVDPAALIASQAARIAELEDANNDALAAEAKRRLDLLPNHDVASTHPHPTAGRRR